MPNTVVKVFKIKKGSLYPSFVTQLTGPDGGPLVLTGCTLLFIMKNKDDDTQPLISGPAFVIAGAEALPTGSDLPNVQYDWQAGDTDVPANYEVEIEVTYPDGKPLRAPAEGFNAVKVNDNLGNPV